MRQPLWAVSSSLLFLGILGQLVFVFLQKPIVRRSSIEPDNVQVVEKKINAAVDIKKIYEVNDLFHTYVPKTIPIAKNIEQEIPPIPQEPSLIPLMIPVEPQKVFIAPLPVVLKGVVYIHDNPQQSVAIIQFQDSKEEFNYRVGQLINDAQVLKIYPNRVIVVRSGGQQETLYLRDADAGKDLASESSKEISGLVIPLKAGVYQVPVEKITNHIKNLGQFIDVLDLTTVYKKGKSIGCRVGRSGKDSLGSKLGFVMDDIVQQVDGLPVTDISSRVLVFDHVASKKIGDIITVQVERSGKPVSLHYALVHSSDKKVPEVSPVKMAPGAPGVTAHVDEQALYNLEEQRKRMLEHKVKMAPTGYQLEMEERKKMFEARRREMLANRHNQVMSPTSRFGQPGQQFIPKELFDQNAARAKG